MKKLFNKVSKEVLKENLLKSNDPRTTLSFYQYANIEDPQAFRDSFYEHLFNLGVFGRIYVATEGVNGQMSILTSNLEAFKSYLDTIPYLKGIRLNIAIEDDGKSFYKLKIQVKSKIVADGLNDDDFDPTKRGVHLDAEAFNQLAAQPDTVIVDMRNHYESEVGHFKGAIKPDVETFRESLPIVEHMLADKKDKNILMYCTGGIRCEKASAYLKHKGFERVHQLDGGIIEYARQVEKNGLDNHFIGKNFVFDERMGERISEDVIAKCHQCGVPCDDHVNCSNDACHILFIQCPSCSIQYEATCSVTCKDFNKLPDQEKDMLRGVAEFNGTKFGKGRYKAHRNGEEL